MDTETVKTMTIKELDLSIRSTNCLARAEIFTVQDLLDKIKTPDDLIRSEIWVKNQPMRFMPKWSLWASRCL